MPVVEAAQLPAYYGSRERGGSASWSASRPALMLDWGMDVLDCNPSLHDADSWNDARFFDDLAHRQTARAVHMPAASAAVRREVHHVVDRLRQPGGDGLSADRVQAYASAGAPPWARQAQPRSALRGRVVQFPPKYPNWVTFWPVLGTIDHFPGRSVSYDQASRGLRFFGISRYG